jgi:hypothetical protein
MCTYLVKFINTCLRDVHSPLPFCFILSGIPIGLMENNDADKKETDDSTTQRRRKVRKSLVVCHVDAWVNDVCCLPFLFFLFITAWT